MRIALAVLFSALLILTTKQPNINSLEAKTANHSTAGQRQQDKLTAKPQEPAPKVPAVAPPAPQPPVTQATQVTTYASGCSTYGSIFRQYAWNVSVAEAICMAESSGDPYNHSSNTNGTIDRGLMQINSIHSDMVDGNLSALYNPTVNIAVAWRIYSADGWRAWSAYKNGHYLRYL